MGHDEPERWGSHRGEKLAVRQEELWVIDEKLLLGVDHGRFAILLSANVCPSKFDYEVAQNRCCSR